MTLYTLTPNRQKIKLTFHVQFDRRPQHVGLHVRCLARQLRVDVVTAEALEGDVAVRHDGAGLRVPGRPCCRGIGTPVFVPYNSWLRFAWKNKEEFRITSVSVFKYKRGTENTRYDQLSCIFSLLISCVSIFKSGSNPIKMTNP